MIDLRTAPPRSPFATLAGIRWLPRMIDRARAQLAGTLGDYDFPTKVDGFLLEFFGIDVDTFVSEVAAAASDDDLAARLLARRDAATLARDREELNERISARSPVGDPEREQEFRERLLATGSARTDITTYFQLLALEEHHEVVV
jgi:hypothetical protein